jgi:hypothetical protein
VQFEVVEVSGPNQYRVWPLELVSTAVPSIVLDSTMFPAELEELLELPAAAGVLLWAAGLLELEPELAQAARASTTAASPAALHSLRMPRLPLIATLPSMTTYRGGVSFTWDG